MHKPVVITDTSDVWKTVWVSMLLTSSCSSNALIACSAACQQIAWDQSPISHDFQISGSGFLRNLWKLWQITVRKVETQCFVFCFLCSLTFILTSFTLFSKAPSLLFHSGSPLSSCMLLFCDEIDLTLPEACLDLSSFFFLSITPLSQPEHCVIEVEKVMIREEMFLRTSL